MPNIFINYRRSDSSGYAGRLLDHLTNHFDQDSVFMDVKGISPGDDLMTVIEKAIGDCQVLLAVIGPQWLSVANNDGKRRLDDSQDYVRLEIATALKRNILVIPVLVGGAAMPTNSDLPSDLQGLTKRLAVTVDDRAFGQGVRDIIQKINKEFSTSRPIPMPQVKQNFSDKQKRDFLYASFAKIRAYFQAALLQLESNAVAVETALRPITDTKFVAEIYVQGKLGNQCKIWIDSYFGHDSIKYWEGRIDLNNDNTFNDMISVETDGQKAYLRLITASTFSYKDPDKAKGKLDAELAAELLWIRFVNRLK